MDSDNLFNIKSELAAGKIDRGYLFMAEYHLDKHQTTEAVGFALASLNEAFKVKSETLLFENEENLFPVILKCIFRGVAESDEKVSILQVWNAIPDIGKVDVDYYLAFSQYLLINYLDKNKFSLNELSEVHRIAFNEILDIFIPWNLNLEQS